MKFLVAALTAAGVALVTYFVPTHARSSHPSTPAQRVVGAPDHAAQAARMRTVSLALSHELTAATRCERRDARYTHCVRPALRHAAMGGRTAAFVLQTVIAPVRSSSCGAYLAELQAANAAASDEAQWTLSQLSSGSRRARAAAPRQVRLMATMLDRATARPPEACAPGADGPAL